jgi:membrane fusion protein (multidrug efflux system)
MRKRMILMLIAMTAFIVAIGLVKFFQIKAAIAQGSSWAPPPEAVTTVVASEETWPSTVEAIGSLEAVHGVTVSADLPGIVEKIEFDSGRRVRSGEVLVRLDTSQERAQLASAIAQRDLAQLNLERSRKLLKEQVIAQADYDQLAAQAKQAEAGVGGIRATIERKTIRAPFSGVLGIRKIDKGQYVNSGDPIVPLQTMDPIFVDFAVPQQNVGALKVGAEVQISADSIAVTHATGRITAINSVVDETTRNVQVQATLENPRSTLRPGMFVNVDISLGRPSRVVALPASAISYAPYGNSVFIVGDVKGPNGKTYRGVRQEFVKLGSGHGDQVAVVSGVKPGEEVVTSGVFKLRNGAAVQINNKSMPGNNPTPKPEDS